MDDCLRNLDPVNFPKTDDIEPAWDMLPSAEFLIVTQLEKIRESEDSRRTEIREVLAEIVTVGTECVDTISRDIPLGIPFVEHL